MIGDPSSPGVPSGAMRGGCQFSDALDPFWTAVKFDGAYGTAEASVMVFDWVGFDVPTPFVAVTVK